MLHIKRKLFIITKKGKKVVEKKNIGKTVVEN